MAVFRVRPTGYAYPIGLSFCGGTDNVAPTTTGGTQTADGSGPTANMVHTFTTSGTFTAGFTGNVEYLIVAGGGGAANRHGGGGGAGGLLYGIGPVIYNTSYTVTVGAGGTGGSPPSGSIPGSVGSNSCISTIVATCAERGGGGIAYLGDGGTSPGGSGGGGACNPSGSSGGTGKPGQGNPGGANDPVYQHGGGGGGAGGAGGNSSLPKSGNGGAGLTYSISGSPLGYAGGGVGAYLNNGDTSPCFCAGTTPGDFGGGCAPTPVAGNYTPAAGCNGTANRGGGGGGTKNANVGGTGGSGVVIVRYVSIQTIPNVYSVN